MLSICFVSKEYPPETGGGGIGTHLEALAQGLVARGNSVIILSSTNHVESSYSFRDGIHLYRFPYPKHKYNFINKIVHAWNVRKNIYPLITKHNIQIVEVPEYGGESIFIGLLRIPAPHIVRLHSGTYLLHRIRGHNFLRPSAFLLVLLEWLATNLADVVTAPTSNMADISRRTLRLAHCNIIVIPNAVKSLVYPGEQRLSAALKQILYVGRLERNKSPELLSQIIPEIIQIYPEANFVFIGLDTNDSPQKTSMQEYCKTFIGTNFAKNVRFLGKQPHEIVMKYMRESDIFVLPSNFESFGIAYVEAMLNRLPIIALRGSGVEEVVPDGQAGIFVSPNSALALKDAILLLLKDDELRETMGNTGQTYALANYSASVVAEAHENLYRSVLDGKV